MDVGIPVEIEGLHGEFYAGVVCGLDSQDELKVNVIAPDNNVVMEVTLPPSALRLPPEPINFPFEPSAGQEVDVLIPCVAQSETNVDASTTSPLSNLSAWWPGRVKKIAGGFVIIELAATFQGDHQAQPVGDTTVWKSRLRIQLPPSIEKTDVVEKHQLRPRSHEINFTSEGFHVHTINIPDRLAEYCRDPANYQHFARRCGSPVLVCMATESFPSPKLAIKNDDETYDSNARLLVISTDISVVKRAAVIDSTFIDMLRQKVLILQQTEELSRKLEASKGSQQSTLFYKELHIPEELIPHAIGFQRANLRRASEIDGIVSIKLDRNTCSFQICGKTEESVDAAKAILDYTAEIVHVPRVYVNPILGAGRRHLQHIVDCVGLRGWKVSDSPETNLPDFVSFELTGTAQSVSDAQMFLDFHISGLQELDRLRGVESPLVSRSEKGKDNDCTTDDKDSDNEKSKTNTQDAVSTDDQSIHRGRRQTQRSPSSQPSEVSPAPATDSSGINNLTEAQITSNASSYRPAGNALQRGRRMPRNNAQNRLNGNPSRRNPERIHAAQNCYDEPEMSNKQRQHQRNGNREGAGGDSATRRPYSRIDQQPQVNVCSVPVAVPAAM